MMHFTDIMKGTVVSYIIVLSGFEQLAFNKEMLLHVLLCLWVCGTFFRHI